jgi:hypothetical protein
MWPDTALQFRNAFWREFRLPPNQPSRRIQFYHKQGMLGLTKLKQRKAALLNTKSALTL